MNVSVHERHNPEPTMTTDLKNALLIHNPNAGGGGKGRRRTLDAARPYFCRPRHRIRTCGNHRPGPRHRNRAPRRLRRSRARDRLWRRRHAQRSHQRPGCPQERPARASGPSSRRNREHPRQGTRLALGYSQRCREARSRHGEGNCTRLGDSARKSRKEKIFLSVGGARPGPTA